jgi:hypothetical protein
MREAFRLNKNFVLAAIAVVVAILAMLPLAHSLDDGLDDARPLFENRSEMASLQYQLVLGLGTVSETTVAPGESVVVFPTEDGEGTFTAAPDSEVSVKPVEDGFCVRAVSVASDAVAPWRCWDNGVDPLMEPGEPL